MWNKDNLSSNWNFICAELNLLFYFSVITLRGVFCRSSASLSLCSQNSLYPQETFTAPCPFSRTLWIQRIVECCKRLLAVSLPGKIDHLWPPSVVCFQLCVSAGRGFSTQGFLELSGCWLQQLGLLWALSRERLCMPCAPLALLHSEPSLQTAWTENEPNKLQINADLVVLYWQYTHVGV